MWRTLLGWASPSGADAHLSVLIFHRVLAQPDALHPAQMHARQFDAICGWLKRWCNVLPLDMAAAQLANATLPARAACITFDDGYADNHTVALPILQRHGLSATFFIATGFLDGGCMWNDRVTEAVRACPTPQLNLSALDLGQHALASTAQRRNAIDALLAQLKYRPLAERVTLTQQLAHLAGVTPAPALMMRAPQVQALHRAGMQIGAHTVSHPILAQLDAAQARQEMADSQRYLQQLLDTPVELFAYPNGKPGVDYTSATRALVRELGFKAAVSTEWGASRHGDDLFQLRRFTPWDQQRERFAARLWRNVQRAPSQLV